MKLNFKANCELRKIRKKKTTTTTTLKPYLNISSAVEIKIIN